MLRRLSAAELAGADIDGDGRVDEAEYILVPPRPTIICRPLVLLCLLINRQVSRGCRPS